MVRLGYRDDSLCSSERRKLDVRPFRYTWLVARYATRQAAASFHAGRQSHRPNRRPTCRTRRHCKNLDAASLEAESSPRESFHSDEWQASEYMQVRHSPHMPWCWEE